MPFPVDIQFIKAAETKLGCKFPPDFVVRMVRMNGGQVRATSDAWDLHPFLDTTDRRRLRSTCNDIVRETCLARDWPDFPENGVAIGANGTGDRLILLIGDDGVCAHEVYWWDHETGELNLAADDFTKLKN